MFTGTALRLFRPTPPLLLHRLCILHRVVQKAARCVTSCGKASCDDGASRFAHVKIGGIGAKLVASDVVRGSSFRRRLPFWQEKSPLRTPFLRLRMRFWGHSRGRNDTASEGVTVGRGAETGSGNEPKKDHSRYSKDARDASAAVATKDEAGKLGWISLSIIFEPSICRVQAASRQGAKAPRRKGSHGEPA